MAVGDTGYSSAQPAQYQPTGVIFPATTRTWGTTGNTDTVRDASVHPGSVITVTPTVTPNGFWQVVVSQGSFVVTSTDSEDAGTTYNYRIHD